MLYNVDLESEGKMSEYNEILEEIKQNYMGYDIMEANEAITKLLEIIDDYDEQLDNAVEIMKDEGLI
jgi:tetrahydromethanopterin S-methyltransferase subunit B